MRTTPNITNRHLERAKELAGRSRRRLSDVVDAALALHLVEGPAAPEEAPCVLPTFDGGASCPSLDPDDIKDLLMEQVLANLERIGGEPAS